MSSYFIIFIVSFVIVFVFVSFMVKIISVEKENYEYTNDNGDGYGNEYKELYSTKSMREWAKTKRTYGRFAGFTQEQVFPKYHLRLARYTQETTKEIFFQHGIDNPYAENIDEERSAKARAQVIYKIATKENLIGIIENMIKKSNEQDKKIIELNYEVDFLNGSLTKIENTDFSKN